LKTNFPVGINVKWGWEGGGVLRVHKSTTVVTYFCF